MENYKNSGEVVTLTAPSGGVVSGTGYLIGVLFVVAIASADEGDKFAGRVTGVVNLPAAGNYTEGAALYWDDGNSNLTTTATDNYFVGHAVAATANSAIDVRLHGASYEEVTT